MWWKQILENRTPKLACSQSHLAQPPAFEHILPVLCLANCFFSSRGMEITTYPVICSRATPALHLEVLAFEEWRQERGGPKMGRQQIRAEELS